MSDKAYMCPYCFNLHEPRFAEVFSQCQHCYNWVTTPGRGHLEAIQVPDSISRLFEIKTGGKDVIVSPLVGGDILFRLSLAGHCSTCFTLEPRVARGLAVYILKLIGD